MMKRLLLQNHSQAQRKICQHQPFVSCCSNRWLRSFSSSNNVQVTQHHHHGDTSNTTESRRALPEDGLMLGDFVQQQQQQPPLQQQSSSIVHPSNGKSFHIKTYGCQMNVNDSDIVRAVLLRHGYIEAMEETSADIWLTNTCAIRDKAEQKVWQRLRHLKKRQQPHQKVGLLGCMAERLQSSILEKQLADMVVGPDAYRELPHLIQDLYDEENGMEQTINVQLSLEETYQDIVPIRSDPNSHSAFVSIQRGCSNRCSFCIVPFTRGQERSRPFESIVSEIQQMVEQQNLKEVVLLGQNVNSYHDRSEDALLARPDSTLELSNSGFRNRIRRLGGGYHFADLVHAVSQISPELRVRFTSPHPKDYPQELLQLMADTPNICNQLHMPAQSGSTSMLKRMKRGYSREAYIELIDTVRSTIPDVALSSDFIAGFCQETPQEHEDTLSLLEYVQYEQAFLFAYSLREKTHAHRVLQDNVPAEIKQARLQELIDTFRNQVHAKNQQVEVGKLRLVLLEGPAKRSIDDTNGRTDQNKRILFTVDTTDDDKAMAWEERAGDMALDPNMSPSMVSTTQVVPGDYAVVQVTEAKGHTLRGQLLWKTTLTNFAKWESNVLSKLSEDRFKEFQRQFVNNL